MNKPVAWIYERNDGVKFLNWKNWKDNETCNGKFIPLYTHPVKELTDFEIMQISQCYPDRLYFAKAILRKAQEK